MTVGELIQTLLSLIDAGRLSGDTVVIDANKRDIEKGTAFPIGTDLSDQYIIIRA